MNNKEEEILHEFNGLKEDLEKWGKVVDEELVSLIDNLGMSQMLKIPPSFRLKSDKSYIDKALYRKKEYENPLLETEDKIGTRVVLLKTKDVSEVSNAILNSSFWNSKETKSITEQIESKPTIFDYQSQHIVVHPIKDSGFDNQKIDLLTCEIQIRTLLQHAFAEVSHDSTYKGPFKNDKELIRHLSKSMALMEATDDYFCSIFEMLSDEKRVYANFLNELIRIYKEEFDGSFEKENLSFELTESFLSLIDLKPIEISDLEKFIIKKKLDLSRAFKPKNGMLFNQPISILISYYLFEHSSFLEKEWPINERAYRNYLNNFGISSGDF